MVQVLSTFVLQKDITKSKLEEMINQTISARKFQHAKHHATICGAGQPSEIILHRGNIAKKQNIVDRFVAYCLAKGVMTANGRTLAIPGKDSISLPIVKRLEGKQPLMKSFEDDERSIRGISDEGRGRNQRREYVSLRRQAIGDIIAVVCPEIHTSKAALDVVGQLYGTNNFNLLRTKLVQLEAMLPTLNDEILMLKVSMSAAEEALSHKYKFRSKKDFGSAVDTWSCCSLPLLHVIHIIDFYIHDQIRTLKYIDMETKSNKVYFIE